jgi:hypothetical protein
VLIVQTHADKDRGDLVYCGDGHNLGTASDTISDVRVYFLRIPDHRPLTRAKFFNFIVGPELREFIRGREYSLMVLSACGSVVNVPEALHQLRGVVSEYVLTSLATAILHSPSHFGTPSQVSILGRIRLHGAWP